MIPDNDLVRQIKDTGDESALLELVNRHSGLYYKTVAKNAPFCRVDDIKDDYYRRKEAEIFKAAKSFDENKGSKFSSWLSNQTRYTLLTERSFEKKEPSFSEFKEEYGGVTEDTPETELDRKDQVEQILSFVKDNFNDRIMRIFKLKWFGNDGRGMNFDQIGEEENISSQAAHQNYTLAFNKVKEEFKDYYAV